MYFPLFIQINVGKYQSVKDLFFCYEQNNCIAVMISLCFFCTCVCEILGKFQKQWWRAQYAYISYKKVLLSPVQSQTIKLGDNTGWAPGPGDFFSTTAPLGTALAVTQMKQNYFLIAVCFSSITVSFKVDKLLGSY